MRLWAPGKCCTCFSVASTKKKHRCSLIQQNKAYFLGFLYVVKMQHNFRSYWNREREREREKVLYYRCFSVISFCKFEKIGRDALLLLFWFYNFLFMIFNFRAQHLYFEFIHFILLHYTYTKSVVTFCMLQR